MTTTVKPEDLNDDTLYVVTYTELDLDDAEELYAHNFSETVKGRTGAVKAMGMIASQWMEVSIHADDYLENEMDQAVSYVATITSGMKDVKAFNPDTIIEATEADPFFEDGQDRTLFNLLFNFLNWTEDFDLDIQPLSFWS